MSNTVVDVKVMGEVLGASLPNKLRFSALADVNTDLQGQPGDTVTRAKYAYIGEATKIEPGAEIPVTDMTQTSQDVKIVKAGKGVQLLDEDVNKRGQEIIDETYNQLEMSILDKIDSDSLATLKTTSVVKDASSSGQISYDSIVDAVALFGEEDDEPKVLFINTLQKATLLKDPNFIRASQMGDQVVMKGIIGEIGGCQVKVSNKIKEESTKYNNLIVKAGALGIDLKRNVNIEEDRVPKKGLTEYYANAHYVTFLKNEKKCVKLTVSKNPAVFSLPAEESVVEEKAKSKNK